MTLLAVIGPTALYLLFAWLLSAIAASDLSDRKGYGEKPGLASGLLTAAVGVIGWLLWPPRPGSQWSRHVRLVDLLTAILAFALLITLFLNWFSGSRSFFEGLQFYELLVPIAVVLCYGQLHARAGGRAPEWLGNAVLGSAVLAVVMIVVAILTPPDDASVEFPTYIALVLSIAMAGTAAAAARVNREESGSDLATVAEARSVGAETS
jgi:hypothetical protein